MRRGTCQGAIGLAVIAIAVIAGALMPGRAIAAGPQDAASAGAAEAPRGPAAEASRARVGQASPLRVGTKSTPPFAMERDDGTWTGISVELWRALASKLGLRYDLRVYDDLQALLGAVERREIDLAIGAVTVNGEREARMDFSHPMYSTGLTIAVMPRSGGGVMAVVRAVLSWELLGVVALLLALLAGVGALVWLVERRRNPAQFDAGALRGIGAGIWWSATTMTTVGYGDKAPVTLLGRALGLVWMFGGILMISTFTAAIASALTVNRLESAIRGPDDLARVRTATVAGSTSAAYLERRDIAFRPVASPLEGLRAVARGEVDAMVYDAPVLQYLVKEELDESVLILPSTFERQDYSFALPSLSPLREELNRALLDELRTESWRDILARYVDVE